MFKKLLISTAVLAMSSSIVFAGPSYKGENYKGEAMPTPCPTWSPAGPYVGLSVGPVVNYSKNTDAVYQGGDATLSLGYGAVLAPSFYLAGELFIEGGGGQNINNGDDGDNLSVKSTWGYGASIIPGYMITDRLLGYVRGGVIRSKFKDGDSQKTGWQAGVGGQAPLVQNWDIRAEYIYSQYTNVGDLGRVRSNQFNIGVVYRFV